MVDQAYSDPFVLVAERRDPSLAGVAEKPPSGSPLRATTAKAGAQLAEPQPSPVNISMAGPVGTKTFPSAPTLGEAVTAAAPNDPVHNELPEALEKAPRANDPPLLTAS